MLRFAQHDTPLILLIVTPASTGQRKGGGASRNSIESERVFITHLFSLFFRHSNEGLLHKAPGSWIGRRDMRIIGLPHYVVDADQLAQLDAGLLVPEVDVDLAPKNFARLGANAFFPQLPPLPFMIASLKHVTHPTETGLRASPLEPGITVEDPGKDQVRN